MIVFNYPDKSEFFRREEKITTVCNDKRGLLANMRKVGK